MKKIFILIVASLMMVMGVNAQVKATANSKVFDNTYATVFGGAFTPMSFNSVFPLNGVAGVKIGKDITPYVGVNAEGVVSFGSAINKGERFSMHEIVRGVYVGVNGTLNWTNIICGYNPNRTFTIGSETGLGWVCGFNSNGYGDNTNDLGAKTALTFNWGLGSTKAWNVFVEPTVYWNLTEHDNGVKFNKNHAQVGIEVGLTYRFENSHGTHNFVVGNIYDDAYVSGLNDEINRLRGENDALKNRPTNTVTNVIEKTNIVDKTTIVTFAYDSDELTESAKTTLNAIPMGVNVDVTATASPEGDEGYNKTLSEHRAANVADYLTKRGVNVKSVRGLGATDDASNRIAIVVAE